MLVVGGIELAGCLTQDVLNRIRRVRVGGYILRLVGDGNRIKDFSVIRLFHTG